MFLKYRYGFLFGLLFFLFIFTFNIIYTLIIKPDNFVPSLATPVVNLDQAAASLASSLEANLELAKTILEQISAATDERGFYGDYQTCWQTDGVWQCQLDLSICAPEGTACVTHRYTPLIIWARYQYYQRTKDQDQLAQMQTDLDHLLIKVLDNPDWQLLSDLPNCLFLKDLALSLELDKQIKIKAARVCNEATPEIAPPTVWQQRHPERSLAADQFDGVNLVGEAFPDPPEPSPADAPIYDLDELASRVASQIYSLYQIQLLGGDSPQVVDEDAALYYYAGNKGIAALDQIGAAHINQQMNPELVKENILDYLLLTHEFLAWHLQQGIFFDSPFAASLQANLHYFFTNFLPVDSPLTPEIQAQILSFDYVRGDDEPTSNLYSALIRGVDYDLSLDLETLNFKEVTFPGYLIPSNLDNSTGVYPILVNARLAGTLSKYAK